MSTDLIGKFLVGLRIKSGAPAKQSPPDRVAPFRLCGCVTANRCGRKVKDHECPESLLV
ncbi:hypothetical protein MACH10_25110 [Thalassospira tepidiphila]|nr:hypothetical protein MACH10_25110 [Thalassospira tepidiphila]